LINYEIGYFNKYPHFSGAKKLTSARSWCKGRAETWEDDSHGMAKGEHNHQAEHDVAELEYFKVTI
jgi:hypothetical protein